METYTESVPAFEQPQPKPPHQGLLAFLCWVKNDPDWNDRFHKNEEKTMEAFGIQQGPLMELVKDIGKLHDDMDKAKELADKLWNQYIFNEIMGSMPRNYW